MKFPNIFDVKRDLDWMDKYAMAIYEKTISSIDTRKREELCWSYFNSNFDNSKFEYLTEIKNPKTGEIFSLPAKIRNISIQRAPINHLISQATRRPIVFGVHVKDNESKEQKQIEKFYDMLRKIETELKTQSLEKKTVILQMQQQLQQLSQMAQMEPKNEQEAQQLEQIRQQLPMAELQINTVMEEIQKSIKLNDDRIEELGEYYTYSYQELKEKLAHKSMKVLITQYNIRYQRKIGITDRFVTGKEYRFIDYVPHAKKVDYKTINSMNVYYPVIPGIEWVQDGPWVALKDYISLNQAMEMYKMTPDIIAKLAPYDDNNSTEYAQSDMYSGSVDTAMGIERVRIFWKVPRKIIKVTKENPHSSTLDFTQFYLDEVSDKDKKNAKDIAERYKMDMYEGVILAGQFTVGMRKKEEALTDKDDYMKLPLPVVGKTYSNIAEQPYSLVWATKDIQDLYLIINYHKELLIAISGVKGQIIDVAQKPEGMSLEEHRYHVKTGTMYIETVRKTGRVNSSYNQWKDYDNTLPQSVQTLDNMLMFLKQTALEIIGVPQQRLGHIVETDQVGTSQQAKEQSMLTTEILYYEHDEVDAKAMEQMLNYYTTYIAKDGAILDLKTSEGIEFVNIPKNLLNTSRYSFILENSFEQEQNKNDLKQMAFRQAEKGALPFDKMLDIYAMDSLTELQKSFKIWSKKAQELAAMSAQNEVEAKKQADMELKKFTQEHELQLKQMELKLQEFDLQIRQKKVEYDNQNAQQKLQIDNRKIDVDASTTAQKTLSERDIEMQYLAEQNRGAVKNEQLNAVQLQLQQLQITLNALTTHHQNILKGREIEIKSQQPKEKIKD